MTIKEFMKLKSSDNGQNNRYTVWDADTLREIGEFYAYDLAGNEYPSITEMLKQPYSDIDMVYFDIKIDTVYQGKFVSILHYNFTVDLRDLPLEN